MTPFYIFISYFLQPSVCLCASLTFFQVFLSAHTIPQTLPHFLCFLWHKHLKKQTFVSTWSGLAAEEGSRGGQLQQRLWIVTLSDFFFFFCRFVINNFDEDKQGKKKKAFCKCVNVSWGEGFFFWVTGGLNLLLEDFFLKSVRMKEEYILSYCFFE